MYLSPCSPEINTLFVNQLYPNPQWVSGKNLPAMQETQETWVQSLGRKDPRRRKRQPTSAFSSEKCHGQRSLAGYSSQGCKESDTTE